MEPKNSLKKVSEEKDKNLKILRQNEAKIGYFRIFSDRHFWRWGDQKSF